MNKAANILSKKKIIIFIGFGILLLIVFSLFAYHFKYLGIDAFKSINNFFVKIESQEDKIQKLENKIEDLEQVVYEIKNPTPTPKPTAKPTSIPLPTVTPFVFTGEIIDVYVIKSGDLLSDIASHYYGSDNVEEYIEIIIAANINKYPHFTKSYYTIGWELSIPKIE